MNAAAAAIAMATQTIRAAGNLSVAFDIIPIKSIKYR
jgi:hypothetical protein